ncbi:unnamed protein product [Pedinophyceae sp. YPF-701]|nr:unnamed protein product [Pedinophyceae sp. YPF-701]
MASKCASRCPAGLQSHAACRMRAPSRVLADAPRRVPRGVRPVRRSLVAQCAAGWKTVDVEAGKVMLDRERYLFLDVRSERAYDEEHLTKPPRCTVNAPIYAKGEEEQKVLNPNFMKAVAAKASPATKLLVACEDGTHGSESAMRLLGEAGYTAAVQVEGGYSAWTRIFSTSGRRKPPPGRWVASGTEALKSGLNIPGVAESYTEGGDLEQARWVPRPGEEKQ